MTYDEMIADAAGSNRLYIYAENGVQMGIGTAAQITRTVGELSLDVATMTFARA